MKKRNALDDFAQGTRNGVPQSPWLPTTCVRRLPAHGLPALCQRWPQQAAGEPWFLLGSTALTSTLALLGGEAVACSSHTEHQAMACRNHVQSMIPNFNTALAPQNLWG